MPSKNFALSVKFRILICCRAPFWGSWTPGAIEAYGRVVPGEVEAPTRDAPKKLRPRAAAALAPADEPIGLIHPARVLRNPARLAVATRRVPLDGPKPIAFRAG